MKTENDRDGARNSERDARSSTDVTNLILPLAPPSHRVPSLTMKYVVSILVFFVAVASAFIVPRQSSSFVSAQCVSRVAPSAVVLHAKISEKRRKELGIADDEDEYDLGMALDTNTDPLISKIIAGSLIVVILGLLIVGVVIPLTTDYGEGVCNPILTQGRC